jgi:hypothetical protein
VHFRCHVLDLCCAASQPAPANTKASRPTLHESHVVRRALTPRSDQTCLPLESRLTDIQCPMHMAPCAWIIHACCRFRQPERASPPESLTDPVNTHAPRQHTPGHNDPTNRKAAAAADHAAGGGDGDATGRAGGLDLALAADALSHHACRVATLLPLPSHNSSSICITNYYSSAFV